MITLKQKFYEKITVLHYSKKTYHSYWCWVNKYLRYHNCQHATTLNETHIEEFLTHLAVEDKVSSSTQNLALQSILFLYKQVYQHPIANTINAVRAKKRIRKPIVLSESEVKIILNKLQNTNKLIIQLLYGSGLRITECLNLRIQNIDFDNQCIRIYDSKSKKDRITLLPNSIEDDLKGHIQRVKSLHNKDIQYGRGYVQLPHAFHKKSKSASKDFLWQFLFPSRKISPCNDVEHKGRWHKQVDSVSKEVKKVSTQCNIYKRITCHTFRHSFATHLLQRGSHIKMVQEVLGHSRIETTMGYLHLFDSELKKAVSPLDVLTRLS